MILVDCDELYWEFVRALRNDKRVADGFIEFNSITKEQQISYMIKYSNNYRIALFNDKPAGYIGVINDDIRICTHPDYQGLGIGKFMLIESTKIWPSAFAKVKLANIASNKLFIACGFNLFDSDEKFNYYRN